MFTLTNEMMRSIIMDHYANPIHKHEPKNDGYISVHMHSDNCIDDIDVYLKFGQDGKVEDAAWNGTACAISTASSDILCDLLLGKTAEEAEKLIAEYNHMIHEEKFNEDLLEEAIVFINTSKQAARIRCATIGWNAADEILKDK